MSDLLVTAAVHYDVVANNYAAAEVVAASMLESIVEDSDLIGEGRVASIRIGSPVNGAHEFDVTAIVRFRVIQSDSETMRDLATAMLEADISSSSFLSAGGVAFIEQD